MSLPNAFEEDLERSLYKHFATYKGSYPLALEGKHEVEASDKYVLRTDGPYIEESDGAVTVFAISINILIQCSLPETNLYLDKDMLSAMRQAFTTCISIKDSLGATISVAQRLGGVTIRQFNRHENSLTYVTLEAEYEGQI